MKSLLLLGFVVAAFSCRAAVPPDEILTGTDTWGMRRGHLAVVNAVCDEPSPDRISLRGEWKFVMTGYAGGRRNSHDTPFFGTREDVWKDCRGIQVPGCWGTQGETDAGMSKSWEFFYDNSPKPIRGNKVGEGWYRKKVVVPASWKGKRVWLKIGGVKACGWFWVNGQQVAHVYNFCTTCKYDVTDCIRFGEENEVIAQISNCMPSRKGLCSAMHVWGGLYRDVELEATPCCFIDDAWVRGDFDGRRAEVKVKVEGERRNENLVLRVTVEGEVVERQLKQSDNSNNQTIEVPLRNFRPWSPEHPNLYTAKVELVENGTVIQTRKERFGVRKLEVRGKEFYLNGRPYFLRGFGDDHVYPLTGLSPASREEHLRHLLTARKAGFNFVRLHTHCEWPEYFEAADEAGVLVQAELPYINGDIPTENFAFDPVSDTLELWRNFRRYPSFAVYSGGNEGSFGPALDKYLYELVKKIDPDRLKICQDSQMESVNSSANSDFGGGPVTEWPRGSVDPGRPFVCHEYLNLGIKIDARTEKDYTGAWLPPKRVADYKWWLSGLGLKGDWSDRIQDAQHLLQRYWQKHGVEVARADPYCDGFCFWTIVDVVVKNGDDYSSQGLFDAFWRPKSKGFTAEEFAKFNSPTCVLLDARPEGSIFQSGDPATFSFRLSHYGDAPIRDAKLTWTLAAGGRTLLDGSCALGDQPIGPAHDVGHPFGATIPEVGKPVKAVLTAQVGPAFNDWEFWIFPKRAKRAVRGVVTTAALAEKLGALYEGLGSEDELVSAKAVVLEREDEALLRKAVAAGKNVVVLGPVNRTPGKIERTWFPGWDFGRPLADSVMAEYKPVSPDIKLGWWSFRSQVGTAIKDDELLGDLPHEGYLSPLLFRIIGKGRELLTGLGSSRRFVIAGEGAKVVPGEVKDVLVGACFSFMSTRREGSSEIVEVDGLDLVSGFPEGTAILDGILGKVVK